MKKNIEWFFDPPMIGVIAGYFLARCIDAYDVNNIQKALIDFGVYMFFAVFASMLYKRNLTNAANKQRPS